MLGVGAGVGVEDRRVTATMAWRSTAGALPRVGAPCLWLTLLLALPAADGRIGMLATELTSSSFSDFVKKSDRVLVDFYNPSDPQWSEMNLELQNAIREVRNVGSAVQIAKVNINAEDALAKKYVPNGPYPQLMWFQHGESTQYHRMLRKTKNVVDFVLALDRDPIQAFDSEADVRKSVNRAVWAQVPKASSMYKMLEVVALKHMDTVEFAFKEASGSDVRWLEEGEFDNAKYEGEVSTEALEKWVRAHLIRSEPVPEPQDGDSIPVVGQTFEELVLREDKDVFLLIYAPWCGFSRKFMPTFEALARRVSHVTSLAVAKMDGDRNGSPYPEDFSWNAYPTVFFVKAGTRRPVVFHGNRTEARLLDFAREHGTRLMVQELDASLNRSQKAEGDAAPDEWEL